VKEFQKSVGATIDGKCGPATIIALIRLTKIVSGGVPSTLRQNATQQSRGPALANKVIVLNPDSDNEIAYDVAVRTEGRLLALGASVFLTRGTSNNPSEQDRIQFSNKSNADLMISLNLDSYENEKAHGAATYFYGSDTHGVHSIVGERFASLVQREICARTDLANCRIHAKTWVQQFRRGHIIRPACVRPLVLVLFGNVHQRDQLAAWRCAPILGEEAVHTA
jgi:N-acetylmuramoyl-L-alanine amidase